MALLAINDIDMYYEVYGEGESLVLVHGLGSSTEDWEHQITFFAQYFQVIVLDIRGHGKTTKAPGPYSVSLFTGDVATLLERLSVSQATVLGISMGGMIALQLALDFPDLVKRLVVVNTSSELIFHTFKLKLAAQLRFLALRFLGVKGIGRLLSKRLFPRPQQSLLRNRFIQRWSRNDKAAYACAMRALIGWSVTQRLQTITQPVFIVASQYDYFPLADKEKMAARLPDAQVVMIADAHHAVTAEMPELFNDTVGRLLRCCVKNKSGAS